MPKQLIVYEKESGVISQVLRFNQDILSVEALGLDKVFDQDIVGFLFEEPDKYVSLKKDRVFDGKITQLSAREKYLRETVGISDSSGSTLFEDVDYTKIPEHVGIISPWNVECGIANYTRDLVEKLNCRVTIFCEKSNPPDSDDSRIKVIPCWTNRDNSYNPLVELLKKNKIDVVHVQYNHDLMNAGELKGFGDELKECGIRSIMTLHSSKGGVDIYGQHFDEMIVHSTISAQDIIGENTHENQVNIIPLGTKEVPPNKEKRIACIEKDIDPERPIIANFGFLLPQKGIKEQIQALQLVKRKFPNILLLAVCAIHKVQNNETSLEYYEECKELVEELHLKDNVMFITDYLDYDKIFDYLHCSDLIVLPYTNSAAQAGSSAGRTIITANRPVIATDVEIFADLQGIIPKIEPRNVQLLADTINDYLYTEEKRFALLDTIQRFVARTSWDNIAREHEKIYKAFGDIKIDIEGQIYSYFSASVVNRNLACALDELGVDVTLKSVNLAENTDYELGDNSRDLVIKKPHGLVQVKHQFPPSFDDWEGRTKIVYLQAETSVPEEWVRDIEKSDIDFIWAYTSHAKELIRKSGITKPCEVIKCGYDPHLFNENVIPIDLSNIRDSYTKKAVPIDDDTFVFLFVGHAQERKNFKAMFKSYLTEFGKDENVVFVIKSYDGGEVHKVIQELIEYVSNILEKPVDELPKHLYIYEDTEPQVLPTYYKAANVMCQCSRAEGFGKPIVEAMGLGIPSICVLWSGPKDFCTHKNSFPVPHKLVRSTYHVQAADKEASIWAETPIEELRKVMRFCFENPQEVKMRGNQALLDSVNWTTEASAFEVIDFVRRHNL